MWDMSSSVADGAGKLEIMGTHFIVSTVREWTQISVPILPDLKVGFVCHLSHIVGPW